MLRKVSTINSLAQSKSIGSKRVSQQTEQFVQQMLLIIKSLMIDYQLSSLNSINYRACQLMIRHTVLIKKNPHLHNSELAVSLPGIQDGEVLKLTNHHHQIFVTYRLSEKIGERYAEISEQLLSLNGFQEGSCVAEVQKCVKVSHLKVKVSKLDWKIVNSKQMKIATQFLQQVQVVWPKAKLPIFYDDCNFVVVEPECEQVGRLDVNTTVEFAQNEPQQAQIGDKQQSNEFEQILVHSGWCDIAEGYVNVVKISNKGLKAIAADAGQSLWVVENTIASISSVQQFAKLAKQEKGKDAQKTSRKLVILSELQHQQDNQQTNTFKCSKLCRKVLDLSDSILISNQSIYKPAVQIISYPIFVKEQDYELTIEEITAQQSTQFSHYQDKDKQIKQILAQKIVSHFVRGKSFFILQELYPFYLQKELYLLRLTNKKKTSSANTFYELKCVASLNEQKITEMVTQLSSKKIRFVSHRQGWANSTLQNRYQHMSQWQAVFNTYKTTSATNSQLKQTENTHILFTTIYEQQLIRIVSFIQSKKFKAVCLVTSFGNNGKTFLHEVLELKGLRMWKINFRELTNPQLTFQIISSYLHWVISHSPYDVLYFDDVDALCAKVQESDQHKRKEKVIGKLIARKINQYLSIYGKRVIATAKSEATLDDQFPQIETVVNLRNPTYELRQKALRAIYVIKKQDDTPVRKVRSGVQVQSIRESDLIKIAEGTQSLPFATYSKHAIQLSQPQTKKSSEKFDFGRLAGLQQAKKTIKSLIEKPIKYGALFKSVPIKLPRGVLLYGSTGNGKTALGSSLKDEFKMKYFSVKGSDILSKYIGGSEAAVRDIFQKAMSVSPSIIFFDEFESIVPKRSANNTGVNDRIVNQFLCYLDGVSSTSGVYIVAASSRPDLIDPAVLRPGRLDAHLFLDYPTATERGQLLDMFEKSVEIDMSRQALVEVTQNFSYSDLIGLLKELRIKKSAEVLKQESYEVAQFKKIDEQLFKKTLGSFKLSVQPSEQAKQRRLYEAFQKGTPPDIQNQKQMQQ